MIAQQKQPLWKLVVDRKNRLELEFQSSVKRKNKFTPIKDSSMQNSKVFSKSRDRSHQSIHGSRHKMNQSGLHKQNKNIERIMLDSVGPKPQISVMASNLSSHTLPRNSQHNQIKLTQSLTLHKTNQMNQNKAFKQLQKQFKQFKQNVYKQLQRQQDLINKMVKQIVFTFQYQLNKLKESQNLNIQGNSCPIQQTDFVTPLKQKMKTLEDVKADLNKKSPNVITQKVSYTNKNYQESKEITDKKKTRQISFSNTGELKFDKFFELMNKLKSDVNQIHQIGMLASPLTSPRGQQNDKFFKKN